MKLIRISKCPRYLKRQLYYENYRSACTYSNTVWGPKLTYFRFRFPIVLCSSCLSTWSNFTIAMCELRFNCSETSARTSPRILLRCMFRSSFKNRLFLVLRRCCLENVSNRLNVFNFIDISFLWSKKKQKEKKKGKKKVWNIKLTERLMIYC